MLPPPVAVVKTPFVKHIKERENSTMQKTLCNTIGPYLCNWCKFIFVNIRQVHIHWTMDKQHATTRAEQISNERTYAKGYKKSLPSTESTLITIFSSWTSITDTWLVEILTMAYHGSQHNFLPFQLLTMINPTVAIFRNHVHCYGQMLDYNLQRWKSKSLLQFGYVYPIS